MDDTMHAEPEIPSPASDDIETHARDAVQAMRACGADRLEIERALIGGAARQARFIREAIAPEAEG